MALRLCNRTYTCTHTVILEIFAVVSKLTDEGTCEIKNSQCELQWAFTTAKFYSYLKLQIINYSENQKHEKKEKEEIS